MIFMALITCVQAGANVTLTWIASTDPVVAGYNIYYGGASRVYTNKTSVVTATSITISNLVNGTTYYFAATTYNAAGAESALSSEISYTVPPPLSGVQLLVTPGSPFIVTMTGPVGSNYVIQASTDLVHWTPFSTNTIPLGGSVNIIDSNPNAAQQFYRAVPYNVAAVPQSPQLSGSSMNHGVFGFVLRGLVGSNYVIQASTDLVHWTPFSTNTIPSGGSVNIIDPNPNSPQKFYRALPSNVVNVPQSPKLAGSIMNHGVFGFVMNGSAGHTYDIQATQDFKTWTVIGTVTVGDSGWINFTDTNAASFSRRFYRSHETLP